MRCCAVYCCAEEGLGVGGFMSERVGGKEK